MQIEYVNPFIESVYEVFETMLNCKVERGGIVRASALALAYETVALIGLSGPARGTVALSFPQQTALSIVNRFIGMEVKEIDAVVSDAVAEIVNIVAGSAKARFGNGGKPIDLGLPSVIHGKEYSVEYPSSSVWLEIPFTGELGPFSLRLTFLFDGQVKA